MCQRSCRLIILEDNHSPNSLLAGFEARSVCSCSRQRWFSFRFLLLLFFQIIELTLRVFHSNILYK
jgi:hypothetical protein